MLSIIKPKHRLVFDNNCSWISYEQASSRLNVNSLREKKTYVWIIPKYSNAILNILT